MSSCRCHLLVSICFAICTATARGADSSAKKDPPAKTPIVVINNAVLDLQREYQAWKKDPAANKLRDKSNFFVEYPNDKLTPEWVVRGLEMSVSGGGSAEAYVKWQLLSGLGGKVPEELVKRAVAIYKKSPAPAAHPGLEHKVLAKLLTKVKKENVAPTNKEFEDAVAKVAAANRPILAYRDDLFSRLPPQYDVLSIALDDVIERASCGLNAGAFFDNVSAGVRSWSIGLPKASEVKSIVAQVTRVADLANSEDSRPYIGLEDKKGIRWKIDQVIAPKKTEELLRFLDNSGGGGLKFKDGKS